MERGDLSKYYVGYMELFEKPDRKGYTTDIKKAGKWYYDEAREMTKFNCASGYGRWYIACSALDSFDGKRLIPDSVY